MSICNTFCPVMLPDNLSAVTALKILRFKHLNATLSLGSEREELDLAIARS